MTSKLLTLAGVASVARDRVFEGSGNRRKRSLEAVCLLTLGLANVDHELQHNLFLNANVGYENDAYNGVSRTDNVLSAGAGIKYLLNRNLYLGGSYGYQQRSSSGTMPGIPYTQSILMLRLSTQFWTDAGRSAPTAALPAAP